MISNRVFLICVFTFCFSILIKGQPNDGSSQCEDMRQGFLNHYYCTLQCFGEGLHLSYIKGNLCEGVVKLGSNTKEPVPLPVVGQIIECITVRCKSAVPPSVCGGFNGFINKKGDTQKSQPNNIDYLSDVHPYIGDYHKKENDANKDLKAGENTKQNSVSNTASAESVAYDGTDKKSNNYQYDTDFYYDIYYYDDDFYYEKNGKDLIYNRKETPDGKKISAVDSKMKSEEVVPITKDSKYKISDNSGHSEGDENDKNHNDNYDLKKDGNNEVKSDKNLETGSYVKNSYNDESIEQEDKRWPSEQKNVFERANQESKKEESAIEKSDQDARKEKSVAEKPNENLTKEENVVKSNEKTAKEESIIEKSKDESTKEESVDKKSNEDSTKNKSINEKSNEELTKEENIVQKYYQESVKNEWIVMKSNEDSRKKESIVEKSGEDLTRQKNIEKKVNGDSIKDKSVQEKPIEDSLKITSDSLQQKNEEISSQNLSDENTKDSSLAKIHEDSSPTEGTEDLLQKENSDEKSSIIPGSVSNSNDISGSPKYEKEISKTSDASTYIAKASSSSKDINIVDNTRNNDFASSESGLESKEKEISTPNIYNKNNYQFLNGQENIGSNYPIPNKAGNPNYPNNNAENPFQPAVPNKQQYLLAQNPQYFNMPQPTYALSEANAQASPDNQPLNPPVNQNQFVPYPYGNVNYNTRGQPDNQYWKSLGIPKQGNWNISPQNSRLFQNAPNTFWNPNSQTQNQQVFPPNNAQFMNYGASNLPSQDNVNTKVSSSEVYGQLSPWNVPPAPAVMGQSIFGNGNMQPRQQAPPWYGPVNSLPAVKNTLGMQTYQKQTLGSEKDLSFENVNGV